MKILVPVVLPSSSNLFGSLYAKTDGLTKWISLLSQTGHSNGKKIRGCKEPSVAHSAQVGVNWGEGPRKPSSMKTFEKVASSGVKNPSYP